MFPDLHIPKEIWAAHALRSLTLRTQQHAWGPAAALYIWPSEGLIMPDSAACTTSFAFSARPRGGQDEHLYMAPPIYMNRAVDKNTQRPQHGRPRWIQQLSHAARRCLADSLVRLPRLHLAGPARERKTCTWQSDLRRLELPARIHIKRQQAESPAWALALTCCSISRSGTCCSRTARRKGSGRPHTCNIKVCA